MTKTGLAILARLLDIDPTIDAEASTHKNPEAWRVVTIEAFPKLCPHTAGRLCSECLEKRLETHHVRILAQDGAPIWTDPAHPDVEVGP